VRRLAQPRPLCSARRSDARRGAMQSVVSVVKPASSSISLSLPVMKASKQIVIASAGKSDKYPLGKAEGMVRALEADETVHSFPAMAFRDGATWILDEGAAALLKNK
jgi:6-phosphogluconolactonase/glucosamine-6-phosphate isomerase/deaminase